MKVFTKQATSGVASPISDEIVLASVPDQPSQVPTRNSQTDEYIIAVDIEAVAGTNGSSITSYHVQIDDGEGGEYTTIKGELVEDMELMALKQT